MSLSSSSQSTNNKNKHDRSKGFNKTQMKFVPKDQNSIRQQSNPSSFTTSLRADPSIQINTTKTSNPPRVPTVGGDNGDYSLSSSSSSSYITTSSRKDVGGGNFVIYLPQDEAVASGLGVEDGGLDPLESQKVVDFLNKELSRLLKLPPRDFWKEVANDTSLHDFLDSFLQFRNRWYDFPHHGAKGGIVAGVIVGEVELSRRVFMVLYRISSNRDPGAPASHSPSVKEHGALLLEKNLLNLPKLFDICAIFGHENEELTRLLVMNAMKAQPMLHENLTAVVSHFLSIIQTMHQRCNSSVEALSSSTTHEDHSDSRLIKEFSEVMDFINDAVVSLDAFVNAYKPAAVYFSCPVEMSNGNAELLTTLARLHDSLLPSLQGGFKKIFAAGGDGLKNSFGDTLPNISTGLKMLSMRIVNLGWKLLEACYLSDEVLEGSLPLPTLTKMVPAKVDDPGIRGDILIQTFKEITEEITHHVWENKSNTFLQNIEKYYQLVSKLDDLRSSGWLFMDDEQFQYLIFIALPTSSQNTSKKSISVPMNNETQMGEDAVVKESKISQVKDIFPDYGKGYIATCLEVYNNNPEEVIQRILEGTLHEELKSLNISLEEIPPPKAASSLSRNDKGKGILVEPTAATSTYGVSEVRKQPDKVATSSVGRFTRKSKVDSLNSETLDSRGDKDTIKTAILAHEYEYDDEYDDSFDDLGLSVAESGFEDTETSGDNERSSHNSSGPKWASQKKPQFYVKDGKNYSYKVSGSVAVGNYQEAALLNETQRDMIHGLGRGGNIPTGAVKTYTEYKEHTHHKDSNITETGASGNPVNFRGRGGRRGGGGGRNNHQQAYQQVSDNVETRESGYQANSRGRGRRGGFGGNLHHHQQQQTVVREAEESGNQANPRGRGGRGGFTSNPHQQQHQESDVGEAEESGQPGNSRGRGRGRGRGRNNNYRKDQAMKKHFAGLGGGF